MASLNLNKVILGGRLTADVELKTTPNGNPVCSFSIAVNRRAAKDGQQQADFINCAAWKGTAEFIDKYFRKGSSICVTGSIQTRSWKDQNGQNRYATEVLVDEAMFVDSKNEAGTAAPQFTATETPKFETISPDDDLPF